MNIETFRTHCLAKKGVSEDLPFDDQVLVFKVLGKMFALTQVDQFESVNLKCKPEQAIELREMYPAVQPGYHMNKKHWNTVYIDGSINDELIFQWLDESYQLVCSGLTKKQQKELADVH